jgi:DNA-binding NarL/FixJ family response regulator
MKTVVLVDDHDLMRRGLAAFFSGRQGWSVAGEAASLAEAEALFEKLDRGKTPLPDLVILDLDLGDSWGLDLIPFLRRCCKKSAPPVLVYSVYNDYAHVRAAIRAGAAGFICKSQVEKDLESAVETILEGKIAFDQGLLMKVQTVTDMMTGLTRRERQIFELAHGSRDNQSIARELNISVRTVENYLSMIYEKTGLHSRAELEKL